MLGSHFPLSHPSHQGRPSAKVGTRQFVFRHFIFFSWCPSLILSFFPWPQFWGLFLFSCDNCALITVVPKLRLQALSPFGIVHMLQKLPVLRLIVPCARHDARCHGCKNKQDMVLMLMEHTVFMRQTRISVLTQRCRVMRQHKTLEGMSLWQSMMTPKYTLEFVLDTPLNQCAINTGVSVSISCGKPKGKLFKKVSRSDL